MIKQWHDIKCIPLYANFSPKKALYVIIAVLELTSMGFLERHKERIVSS